MKTCPKCNVTNLDEARFCEKCGFNFKSSNRKWMVISTLILLTLLIVGVVYFMKNKRDDNTDAIFTPRENVLQAIKDAGVLRVAVESEAPPVNWIDEKGKSTGFEYELISLVAKNMGIPEVKMVYTGEYDEIPNMISQEKNQADIFMGAYIANPNIPNVVWSNSYYDDGYCLIVPEGSAIKSLKDLKGKKVGVYNEDAAEDFITENVPAVGEIDRFEDEDEDGTWMMKHLLSSYSKNKKNKEPLVDAIIYDYIFAKEEIKASNGQLKIVAFNLNSLSYQIGLPKNNYELLKNINAALKQVMDGPDYERLIKKYLDFDATNISLPELDVNQRVHIVVAGETLGSIAQMELGNSQRWKEIWDANKSRIPNPNLIHVNNKLIIP